MPTLHQSAPTTSAEQQLLYDKTQLMMNQQITCHLHFYDSFPDKPNHPAQFSSPSKSGTGREDRSDSFSFLASNNAEGNLKRWPKQWPSFILSFSTLDS